MEAELQAQGARGRRVVFVVEDVIVDMSELMGGTCEGRKVFGDEAGIRHSKVKI